MAATASTPYDVLREELRGALRNYLERHGGTAAGADAVRDVALDRDADRSDVAAAMWTLVDQGVAEYGKHAELTLV